MEMCVDRILPKHTRPADFRLCKISGHMIEILEIQAENPTFHVLFIPGNPGIVTFYKEFIEFLYEQLGGTASITAIGHISQTSKEQIKQKVDFIEHELQDIQLPIVLVGHSIGSYMSIEMFKRAQDKVIYCVGLYPFLVLNKRSSKQTAIKWLAESSLMSTTVCSVVALLGLLPAWGIKCIVKKTLGTSWSGTAVGAACSHLVKYHVMRNVLFMAMTEFKELREAPDLSFMRKKQDQMSFLFGTDDHWGPLTLYEEIYKEVPEIALAVEDEGHTHAFSCSEGGSLWVAQHVACLIKKKTHTSHNNDMT